MREGKMYYNGDIERYDVKFNDGEEYGGLQCGDYFEVKVNGKWQPTRIEHSPNESGYWYFTDIDTHPNETCLYGYPVKI